MILFLLFVLLIYGSFHYYVFLKAKNAFSLNFPFNILCAILLLILMFSPFLLRMFEKKGLHILALITAYAGYVWMGILFLFMVISFLIEAYKLIGTLITFLLKKNIYLIIPSAKLSFLLPLFLSILISIYGYYEAKNIRLERKEIYSSKIPASDKPFRIVQISDIHIGLIMNKERIRKIINIIKTAEPDILVCTGDLIDADEDKIDDYVSLFNEINPKYGKFAVTGNHEFYFGIEKATHFIKKSGFQLLQGNLFKLNDWLIITGEDDPAIKYFNPNYNKLNLQDLSEAIKKNFIILLKHRPIIDNPSEEYFDLQLSGHTHKGQIFPFNLFTKILFPLSGGQLHKLKNSYLYVSRGTGFWGPPIRFLASPEITLIELKKR